VGIRTAEVKLRDTARPWILQFSGTLAIDPAQLTRLRCRFVPAEVVEIGKFQGKDADRELRAGDRVRKGQLLAILRSAEVGLRKTELFDALVKLRLDQAILDSAEKSREAVPEISILTARKNVVLDRNAVERAEHSLLVMGIPSPEIETIRKTAQESVGHKPEAPEDRDKRRNQWSLVELHAVDEGTIVERSLAKNEQVVDNSVNLFQIARLDRLKVLANVPEHDLPLLEVLKPEQRRWVIHTVADALAAPGEFESIGYVTDPNQRTALVTGFVDNKQGRLRPGQSIRASVTLPPPAGELVLPAGALVENGQQDFVFVQPDPAKLFFEQRHIDVVRRGQDVVHVRSRPSAEKERLGFQIVRPGERIVTAGAVELKAVLDDLKARGDR
jgi:cobalt-zinc-cadmium efflux system membrane fusion protein